MFAYLVVVVGRPHEFFPALLSVPFAKITFAGAFLSACSERSALSVRLGSVPIARTALYLFGLTAISILYSIWPVHSVKMVLNDILVLTASFVLIVKLGTSWRTVRIMLLALPVSALLLSVHVLLNYTGARPAGTSYYDPNDLGFALVTILPIVCALAVLKQGLPKRLLQGLACTIVLVILLTESRGGLIGLVLVALAMVVGPIDPRKRAQSGWRRLRAVLIGLIVAAVVGAGTWHVLPQPARTRLATVLSLDNDYNMTESTGRVSIWKRNIRATLGRPIGFGIGSFAAVDIRTGGKFKVAHNMLVQIFVELGFVGLWLFLRLFYVSWRDLGRNVDLEVATTQASAPELERLAICQALRYSLIGMLACGFFLTEAFTTIVWAVFSLAAAIAASEMLRRNERSSAPASRLSRPSRSLQPNTRPSTPRRGASVHPRRITPARL